MCRLLSKQLEPELMTRARGLLRIFVLHLRLVPWKKSHGFVSAGLPIQVDPGDDISGRNGSLSGKKTKENTALLRVNIERLSNFFRRVEKQEAAIYDPSHYARRAEWQNEDPRSQAAGAWGGVQQTGR